MTHKDRGCGSWGKRDDAVDAGHRQAVSMSHY